MERTKWGCAPIRPSSSRASPEVVRIADLSGADPPRASDAELSRKSRSAPQTTGAVSAPSGNTRKDGLSLQKQRQQLHPAFPDAAFPNPVEADAVRSSVSRSGARRMPRQMALSGASLEVGGKGIPGSRLRSGVRPRAPERSQEARTRDAFRRIYPRTRRRA